MLRRHVSLAGGPTRTTRDWSRPHTRPPRLMARRRTSCRHQCLRPKPCVADTATLRSDGRRPPHRGGIPGIFSPSQPGCQDPTWSDDPHTLFPVFPEKKPCRPSGNGGQCAGAPGGQVLQKLFGRIFGVSTRVRHQRSLSRALRARSDPFIASPNMGCSPGTIGPGCGELVIDPETPSPPARTDPCNCPWCTTPRSGRTPPRSFWRAAQSRHPTRPRRLV